MCVYGVHIYTWGRCVCVWYLNTPGGGVFKYGLYTHTPGVGVCVCMVYNDFLYPHKKGVLSFVKESHFSTKMVVFKGVSVWGGVCFSQT